MNMTDYVECLGYKVFRNGMILNKNNKELKQHILTKQIKVQINGKRKNIVASKFVYYAFHRDFDYLKKENIVIFKDGNESNYAIDNLEVDYRGNYLQGENNSSSKLTDKQVEEIKEKYTNKIIHHYTYDKLAKEYGVSPTLICQIINKKARNKRKYIMKNKGDVRIEN